MVDQVVAGADASVTPAPPSGAPGDNGSKPATPPDIFSGLQNAESREWVTSKGIKDLDTIVSDARYGEKLKTEFADFKGKALVAPSADAKPEEWSAFYAKLGRPEKADGYELKLPPDLPPELPYDAEGATAYKQWAHDAGLTPTQAQKLHDQFVKHTAGQWTASTQAQQQAVETAHADIVKDWGPKDSPTYKENLAAADKFIHNNGGEALIAELKAKGLVDSDGLVLAPLLTKAMAKMGKAYNEDTIAQGAAGKPVRDAASTLYPTDPFKR
jgi:hypothetical protein